MKSRQWDSTSLVPRPFPPPVFDRLQHAGRSHLQYLIAYSMQAVPTFSISLTVSDQILEVGTAWEQG